jgi:hypothetical protein
MSTAQNCENPGFKDPGCLTRWTRWFLYAQIVIAVIALVSDWIEYQLLVDIKNGVYELTDAVVEADDARQGLVGNAMFCIFIVSGILILNWIYRANYNARQLGAEHMRFTPGWSIGWYFIPIACFWKPYQAMKEIWQASSHPQMWASRPVSALLPCWWVFWIVTHIIDNVAFQLSKGADEIDEFMIANAMNQFSVVIGILLSLITIVMIGKIHAMQMSHARQTIPEKSALPE